MLIFGVLWCRLAHNDTKAGHLGITGVTNANSNGRKQWEAKPTIGSISPFNSSNVALLNYKGGLGGSRPIINLILKHSCGALTTSCEDVYCQQHKTKTKD